MREGEIIFLTEVEFVLDLWGGGQLKFAWGRTKFIARSKCRVKLKW